MQLHCGGEGPVCTLCRMQCYWSGGIVVLLLVAALCSASQAPTHVSLPQMILSPIKRHHIKTPARSDRGEGVLIVSHESNEPGSRQSNGRGKLFLDSGNVLCIRQFKMDGDTARQKVFLFAWWNGFGDTWHTRKTHSYPSLESQTTLQYNVHVGAIFRWRATCTRR